MTTTTWIEATVALWDGEVVITDPQPYPGTHTDLPLRVVVDSSKPMCDATEGRHVCALVADHFGPHWRCHVDLAVEGPFQICQVVEASS